MIRPTIAHLSVLFVITSHPLSVGAEELRGFWPQWRGPNRDNVSSDTGLRTEWPTDGPPLRWSVKGIGEGIAAVAVGGGRIITLGDIDGHEYITALDERTGRRLWTTPIGQAVGQNPLMRWLSQRTPSLDDDRLYAVTATGHLVCLTTEDGTELWRRSYHDDFGSGRRVWGICDYPLIDGDQLICLPLGSHVGIAALDKLTGRVLWHAPLEQKTHSLYGAVLATKIAGVPQYIAALNDGIGGFSTTDGSRLWWFVDPIRSFTSTHTPMLTSDQSMVCALSYGRGIVRLNASRDGDSWNVIDSYVQKTSIDPFQDGAVCLENHMYTTAWRPGGLTSIDWRSGETAWFQQSQGSRTNRESRSGRETGGRRGGRRALSANRIGLTFADGHLYCLHSDGTIRLVKAVPTEYVEKSSFSIADYQPALGATLPVVTAGRLYVRDNDRLLCFEVRMDADRIESEDSARIVLSKPKRRTSDGQRRTPKPIFVPTPAEVVDRMLELAEVKEGNTIVDLGSGDGRIVIAAAKKYGCRAVGYEIDSELVRESRIQVRAERLSALVTIREEDMFKADLGDVNVVAVYLYPSVLEKMRPLFERMKPGSRIVSHFFEIPGVEPDRRLVVESDSGDGHEILLYVTPLTDDENTSNRR